MKSFVFLNTIFVCLSIQNAHSREFKHGLCAPSLTPRPPSLLSHLPEDAKYLKIVCMYNSQYYYTENFSPDQLDPDLCTHLNYEFAFLDEDSHRLVPGDPKLDLQQSFYKKATNLKRRNPNLKVFLSLGGWDDSTEKYSELVKSPKKRADFIANVVTFLQEHSFDGLDVAWEYPNAWQGDVGACKEDKQNFVTFLQEIKEAFAGKSLGLSASVAPNMNEIEAAYDVPAVSEAVDHLNVMTYDLHGQWEGKTGHHAQFNTSDSPSAANLIASVEEWVKRGAKKEKLVVGTTAYGRTMKLEDPRHHDLGAKVLGPGDPGPITKSAGYMAYNEICYKLENEAGWNIVEDPQVGTYAYKGDQWISYDSLEALANKVEFVVKNGYGGIALKDVTGDDYAGCCIKKYKYPLLLTIIDKVFEAFFAKQLSAAFKF